MLADTAFHGTSILMTATAHSVSLLLGSLLAALVGCGGSSPEDGPGGGGTAGAPGQCDASVLEAALAAECLQKYECGCENTPSLEACVDELGSAVQGLQLSALEEGLHLDCACVEMGLAAWAARDCRPQHEFAAGELFPCDECRRWVGDAVEGEPCAEELSLFDTCAQGLRCHQGTCVPSCEAVSGGSCGGCNLGFGCDEATGTCVPFGREGDPCGQRCDVGFFCDQATQTCTLGAAGGSSCEVRCRSDCDNEGVCEEPEAVVCGPTLPLF